MGYTTDFIRHIEVAPRLGEAEQLYLTAFSASRRWDRPGGPYEVPASPYAERDSLPADLDRYNSTLEGQPSLWCGWVPCWDRPPDPEFFDAELLPYEKVIDKQRERRKRPRLASAE